MSTVRPRSRSSDSPDPTSWQTVRGRVNVFGGNIDEEYHFRRNGRRGDSLPSSLESTPGHYLPVSHEGLNDLASGSLPKFPMTPAEFHLFPSTRCPGNTRNPQDTEMRVQAECIGVNHLTTLRSAAFWELRRSVIENGEGLIRRMRDYEQSRLHQQVRQKAKERKKRCHKSSTLRSRCKARPNVSEASDEDDILIYSEDTSNGLSRWSPLPTRARSLDQMDIDGEDQDRLGTKGPLSTPSADCSQVQLCYDEGTLFTGNSLRIEGDSESYPESAPPTPSSPSISLPIHRASSMTEDRLLVSPSSPPGKALDDLNVAFVNGACSIADYSPIWTYQQQFSTNDDNIRHGDLWR